KKYAKTFAITRGPGGSLVFDGTRLIQTAGVMASAVDTNGAGDMFAGSFLFALAQGKDFGWAADFSNAASSRVVSQFGPRIKAIEYISLKQQFNL
ncbi:PfkB family carbohydrate kinase, partial [Candidatus Pseudothioglobus singularis]|nr:PfkB family carbohydrate kinase [Candidatus Pseudothioglobus singularis]